MGDHTRLRRVRTERHLSAALPYETWNTLRLTARDLIILTRYIRERISGRAGPILLCNSYPKSGTHLLNQILTAIPGFAAWDDTVAVQSLSGTMNSRVHLRWKLGSAPPESVVRAHLSYSEAVLNLLRRREYRRFFIYRDPRDVSLSHARWATREEEYFLWPMYRHGMNSDAQRLMASIVGLPAGTPLGSNFSLPNVAQGFRQYQGWIEDSDTLAVRFEDLVGSRGGGDDQVRYTTIERILKHAGVAMSRAEIVDCFSVETLDPTRSPTFRQGRVGAWKEAFMDEHRVAFQSIAGSLLAELGYADDSADTTNHSRF